MCGKRLKIFLSLSALVLLLSCSPFCVPLYAEVKLTEQEAQQLMEEIQESQKDLKTLRKQLETAEQQLTDVQNDCEEQKKYYEEQLKEAKKQKARYETLATVSGISTALLTLTVLILLL